jgi:hypothetical protein
MIKRSAKNVEYFLLFFLDFVRHVPSFCDLGVSFFHNPFPPPAKSLHYLTYAHFSLIIFFMVFFAFCFFNFWLWIPSSWLYLDLKLVSKADEGVPLASPRRGDLKRPDN